MSATASTDKEFELGAVAHVTFRVRCEKFGFGQEVFLVSGDGKQVSLLSMLSQVLKREKSHRSTHLTCISKSTWMPPPLDYGVKKIFRLWRSFQHCSHINFFAELFLIFTIVREYRCIQRQKDFPGIRQYIHLLWASHRQSERRRHQTSDTGSPFTALVFFNDGNPRKMHLMIYITPWGQNFMKSICTLCPIASITRSTMCLELPELRRKLIMFLWDLQ